MLRSSESFYTMLSLPDLSLPKDTNTEVIALNCWQDVCLSKIWIPSHLLTNRKQPANILATRGIFHTLEKRGHAKKIESFSVYDDDGNSEVEADVFLSDSDNDEITFGLDSSSCERIKIKESSEKSKNFPKLKSFPSCKDLNAESNISLNEILNHPAEIDITNFEFRNDLNQSHKQIEQLQSNKKGKMKKNFQVPVEEADDVLKLNCTENENVESNTHQEILNSSTKVIAASFEYKKEQKQAETSQSSKKNKHDKKKNKVMKSVTLDKFLEDYTEEDKQENYANDYLRKLLLSKNKEGQVTAKNNHEFPDLTQEQKFMQIRCSDLKSEAKKTEISLKSVAEILARPDETEIDKCIPNHTETVTIEKDESTIGKIVIENIPPEACHEDIFTLLCGYGEVINFSLEPDGDFLKALVEIDLIGDIDWITECLNGTEPFGASSKVLKCYKL